uniref:LRRN4 C-terminal-like protein n=2 Tax=Kryptolebias marmoratus TaxID=37003 RepID=A0A3Q3B526_KRYMA
MTALLFFALPLIHSHLFAHAASTVPPTTRRQIKVLTMIPSDDDYDNYDENYSSPPEVVRASVRPPLMATRPKPCQHDACSENQEPCERLSADTGCLCPGRSGGDVAPHAPRIHLLLPITEGENAGKVEVRWCAPSSVVSSYRVIVEGRRDGTLRFGDSSRRGLIGALEGGVKVCVQAVNNAGESSPSQFSCRRFEDTEFSSHNLLALIICGGVAFILVLVAVAVILRRCQKRQKAKRHSADGLGNPSYSTEGALQFKPASENKTLGLSDKEKFSLPTEKVV